VLIRVWLAVVVFALILLGAAAVRLLGRLGGLRRAVGGLQRRRAEAVKLQESLARLQERAAAMAPPAER
jgi:Sec-independent protein translocase protein TatA